MLSLKDLIENSIEAGFGGWDKALEHVAGLVTSSPEEFNNIAYSMIQGIYNALLPIAYNLLALFFLIELLSKATTLEVMKWEQVAKILFKMVLAKVIMENAFGLLEMIFTITSSAISKANAAISSLGGGESIVDQMKASIPSGVLGQIGFLVTFAPQWLLMVIAQIAIYIIVYGRMIEIYLLTAVASLPISTFASGNLQNIGKKFFQSYAGVCLQGMFILIIVKLYGAIATGTAITGGFVAGKMLITNLTTVSLLVKSGTWAKQITGAA